MEEDNPVSGKRGGSHSRYVSLVPETHRGQETSQLTSEVAKLLCELKLSLKQ